MSIFSIEYRDECHSPRVEHFVTMNDVLKEITSFFGDFELEEREGSDWLTMDFSTSKEDKHFLKLNFCDVVFFDVFSTEFEGEAQESIKEMVNSLVSELDKSIAVGTLEELRTKLWT